MENLQYVTPEMRSRLRRLKRPTRPLWPANENAPGAAAAAPQPVPEPSGAGALRRLLRAIGVSLRTWTARRMILRLEAWPDRRLKQIGISRAEIAPAVFRLYGLAPPSPAAGARAPARPGA